MRSHMIRRAAAAVALTVAGLGWTAAPAHAGPPQCTTAPSATVSIGSYYWYDTINVGVSNSCSTSQYVTVSVTITSECLSSPYQASGTVKVGGNKSWSTTYSIYYQCTGTASVTATGVAGSTTDAAPF